MSKPLPPMTVLCERFDEKKDLWVPSSICIQRDDNAESVIQIQTEKDWLRLMPHDLERLLAAIKANRSDR